MQIDKFMKTISGLSDNSRRAYEETLWLFDSDVNGAEPTPSSMQKFLNRYQPSSLHRHKAALKAYWEWVKPQKPWPFNRRSFLAPRQHKLRYVKPDIVMEMIDRAKTKDERMFLRTLFMLGCRIHELQAIDAEALTDAGVVVKTKGGQTKLKVLTKEFMVELRAYAKGKKAKIFPMSYNYYYTHLKELGKEVGHPEVALHMIRHSRAVDLLGKGMKLPYLQQFLGHASINTTAIYTQVTGDELSQQLEELENGNSTPSPPEVKGRKKPKRK
jgi:site-specific recombinase XerD